MVRNPSGKCKSEKKNQVYGKKDRFNVKKKAGGGGSLLRTVQITEIHCNTYFVLIHISSKYIYS